MINALEDQVDRETISQRDFNIAERTRQIQANYANMRGSLTNYYDQINHALPLLMLLSQGNARLGDVVPLLADTMGEMDNGDNVVFSFKSVFLSFDNAKAGTAERAFK